MTEHTEAGELQRELGAELRKWWRFDDYQRQLSSWHEREDFIEKKLPEWIARLAAGRPQEPVAWPRCGCTQRCICCGGDAWPDVASPSPVAGAVKKHCQLRGFQAASLCRDGCQQAGKCLRADPPPSPDPVAVKALAVEWSRKAELCINAVDAMDSESVDDEQEIALHTEAARIYQNCADALRLAATVSAGAGWWQPIETAPKDGAWVLIHEAHGVNTKYSPFAVGHYLDSYQAWFDGDNRRIPNASHWMQLPERPGAQAASTEAAGVGGPDPIAEAIGALRYLADYDRPNGGQSRYNAEHLHEIANSLVRATPSTSPAPAGWKLVPIDPVHARDLVGDDAMVQEGDESPFPSSFTKAECEAVWRSMIREAPPAPVAASRVEDILRRNFYTGEPGEHEAIKNAAKELAALASPSTPSAEPVAWIAFAGNGNIRFWTPDPKMAESEKRCGRDLRAFTLAELVALSARPASPRPTGTAGMREALIAAKIFADDEFYDCVDLPRKSRINKLCDQIDAALSDAGKR